MVFIVDLQTLEKIVSRVYYTYLTIIVCLIDLAFLHDFCDSFVNKVFLYVQFL